MSPPPPCSTLFPYTTLFRSSCRRGGPPRSRRSGTRSRPVAIADRKSTRLNSSHDQTSYAVFCLKKKKAPLEARGRRHPPPPSRPHRLRDRLRVHGALPPRRP